MGVKRTAEHTSEIMRRVRSQDTKPELLLRKALWNRALTANPQVNLIGVRTEIRHYYATDGQQRMLN